MQRENTFHPIGILHQAAHGERRIDAAGDLVTLVLDSLAGDHGAVKDLDALLFAFRNANVHIHLVADFKRLDLALFARHADG